MSTHAPRTVHLWKLYARRHWRPWFGEMHDVTTDACEQYMRHRLSLVTAQSVRVELVALRSFVRTLGLDVMVPSVPKRSLGTPHPTPKRHKPIEMSPAEVAQIIKRLPVMTQDNQGNRFPVRARFIVAYETGLRPHTLSSLSVPEHYRRGSESLTLTPDIDKTRWGRAVPLTLKARDALDSVCPDRGVIFGRHEYSGPLKRAAKAILGEERGSKFSGAHLRSARITHLLEQSGNLPGVQYLVGHKRASTTSRYVRTGYRAAELALGAPKKKRTSKRRTA